MAQGKPGRPRKEQASVSIDADFTRPDPLKIEGRQDGMRYKFLRNDPENINRKRAAGWEIIKGGSPEHLPGSSAADGTLIVGDLIAAKMPEDKARARNEFYRKQGQALMDSARRKIRGGKGYSVEGELK